MSTNGITGRRAGRGLLASLSTPDVSDGDRATKRRWSKPGDSKGTDKGTVREQTKGLEEAVKTLY